jgi:hypothetical protein
MSLIEYAKRELDAIGMTEDSSDEMNVMMRKHILHMVKEFADEDHSGMSASYALSILKSLLAYQPLTPLTGTDDEWDEIGDDFWQNKRAFNVFKDKDGAYWGDGIVFWEWHKDNPEDINEEPFKSYFTSRDSRVNIDSFPWTMPEKPEYREADPDR